MDKNEMSLWDELNHLRLLVMIENREGTFHQLHLTKEQFKKLSNCIAEMFPCRGEGHDEDCVDLLVSDKGISADIFLGMDDVTGSDII